MTKKVLTFDLDGTLINHNNEIIGGNKTIELLQHFQKNGFELVVNTGRLDHDIRHICNKYGLTVDCRISQNGSVISNDTSIKAQNLDIKEALEFYKDVLEEDIRVELNTVSNRYWHSERDPLFPKEFYDSSIIVKGFNKVITSQPVTLFLLIGEPQVIERIQKNVNQKFNKIYAVKTSETSLEILPLGVSKGDAMRKIYPDYEVYAIGDSENDYSLFDMAKYSFLVGDKVNSKARKVKDILEALRFIEALEKDL